MDGFPLVKLGGGWCLLKWIIHSVKAVHSLRFKQGKTSSLEQPIPWTFEAIYTLCDIGILVT